MYLYDNLLQAPEGFCPKCETHHNTAAKTVSQIFKGGKVRLELDLNNGTVTGIVNNCVIRTWKDVTVSQWGDILYTLQTKYANLIS